MNAEERRRLEREVLEIQEVAKTCSDERKRAQLKKRYDEIAGKLSMMPPSPNTNVANVARNSTRSDTARRNLMAYSMIVTLVAALGIPGAYFLAGGSEPSIDRQSNLAGARSSGNNLQYALPPQRASSMDASSAGPIYGKVGEDLESSGITLHVYQISSYQSDNQFDKPPVGYHRLAVEISMRNNSSKVFRPNPAAFEIRDEDGRSFQIGGIPPAPELGSSALYAGDATRGWISLEVPSNLVSGILSFDNHHGPPIRVRF